MVSQQVTRRYLVRLSTGEETEVSFRLTRMSDGWFAEASNFGCSCSYAYWTRAVRELLSAHCATEIMPLCACLRMTDEDACFFC
jgi:hypothetical protein